MKPIPARCWHRLRAGPGRCVYAFFTDFKDLTFDPLPSCYISDYAENIVVCTYDHSYFKVPSFVAERGGLLKNLCLPRLKRMPQ